MTTEIPDISDKDVIESAVRSVGGIVGRLDRTITFDDHEDLMKCAAVLLDLHMLDKYMPEGCTPADARILRSANHAFAERVQKLESALQPFLTHLSSEEFTGRDLRSEWIRRGRSLMAPKETPHA